MARVAPWLARSVALFRRSGVVQVEFAALYVEATVAGTEVTAQVHRHPGFEQWRESAAKGQGFRFGSQLQ